VGIEHVGDHPARVFPPGGTPADIAHYDPALFPYYHLCDAPAVPPAPEGWRTEARGGRLYPGEGELWLPEFVAAFPPGTPAAIEAPSVLHAAAPPAERARLAAAACRRLFAECLNRMEGK